MPFKTSECSVAKIANIFGGHFPSKIRVPNAVKEAFVSEMRKVMQDYEYDNMKAIVEGY